MTDPNAERRRGVVTALQARLLAFLGFRLFLALLAGLGLLAIVAVFTDATVVLPVELRAAAPWALAAAGALIVLGAAVQLGRLSPLRVARLLETATPEAGTAMTNAVQLTGRAEPSAVGEHLRREAVEYGRRKACGMRSWPVVRRGVLLAGLIAGLTAVAWGIGAAVFPDVLAAVLPRFLDPHGDHPPYSRLRITAEAERDEVLFGEQCEIRASASGAPVEKLFLVAENATGRTETVMFRRSDGSYFQTLTNLREETLFHVTDGRARSIRKRIGIRFTPRITLVQITTRFPEYTGLADRQEKLGDEALRVPRGSRLGFRVASNRPLSGGEIELVPLLGGPTRTVELSRPPDRPDGSSTLVEGEFELDVSVAFSIQLRDTEGLRSTEPRRGRVVLLPDRRPRIFVLAPGRNAVATPNISVPVRLRAEDDHGIERVLWYRGLDGSIERPTSMALKTAGGDRRKVEVETALDLADLGLRPGDRIDYFFEAVDNYPDGPNLATSRIYSLEIISERQYAAILRQEAARKALFEEQLALVNHLRRILENARALREQTEQLARKDRPAGEQRQRLARDARELSESIREYSLARKLALKTPQLFDIEEELDRALKEQEDQLQRLQRRSQDFAEKAAEPGEKLDEDELAFLQEMISELESLSAGMDEGIDRPLQHLVSVARLMAETDEFVRLTKLQLELERMLRRFKDRTGEELSRVERMELQELAAAQKRIRDGLKSFLERLPELKDRVPDAEQYEPLKKQVDEFIEAVKKAEIPEELAAATEKLEDQNAPDAHPRAKRAAEKMEELIEKCESMQSQGKPCLCMGFKPRIVKSLGRSLQQILDALKGKSGQRGRGDDGFGLFSEDLGLYGPDIQLRGRQADGRDPGGAELASGSAAGESREDAADPELPRPESFGPVPLQRDARFPLRYREVVGEYFKAVADAEEK